MNTFGTLIRLTTFGESHGPAMGGILDGMPAGVKLDFDALRREMARRRPGGQTGTSPRREADELELLSGLTPEGVTLGSPIGFIVRNRDARPADYDGYQGKFRPNHADYTYMKKYGIHDFRGGGRASARDTVSWVAAGAICRQWLSLEGIRIKARFIETQSVTEAMRDGDSVGGIVECMIEGVKAGVGEPVADKLHARLAAAMMSINAAKAFEYGDGARSATMRGSESLDRFIVPADTAGHGMPTLRCASNHSGGIQGGISNGMPICFRVSFKPTPTLGQRVESVDSDGNPCVIEPRGRHDACVAIRAVPVVEAMAALTIADMIRMAISWGRCPNHNRASEDV